jgi:hypothetical protein
LVDWKTRRAAIRRIVRGAAKDLLIRLSEMVSGGGAECLDAAQPVLDMVPTDAVLVHHLTVSSQTTSLVRLLPVPRWLPRVSRILACPSRIAPSSAAGLKWMYRCVVTRS